jgi:hypothetical protein
LKKIRNYHGVEKFSRKAAGGVNPLKKIRNYHGVEKFSRKAAGGVNPLKKIRNFHSVENFFHSVDNFFHAVEKLAKKFPWCGSSGFSNGGGLTWFTHATRAWGSWGRRRTAWGSWGGR